MMGSSLTTSTGIPLVTQSDPGTENNSLANCHTGIRHRLDSSLEGTLQHRWMNQHGHNVKPEIAWSDFRRHWVPGFEQLLATGVYGGLYDPEHADPIEQYVVGFDVIIGLILCSGSRFDGSPYLGFKSS